MTALDALLAARAYTDGRAQRRSTFRHRHLVERPMAMVPWHLGAEPFTYAALAYGTSRTRFDAMALPGEPRDRRLLFPATLPVAKWFNERFEQPWRAAGAPDEDDALYEAPQVIVPNEGAVTVLRKLGRRLAYLPTRATATGPPPADSELVRFGRHLQFLGVASGEPGQQLIVAASTLASSNWVSEQNAAERGNLAALDAWIAPPGRLHGFDAATRAEDTTVGPLPAPSIEAAVDAAMNDLRTARDKKHRADEKKALGKLEEIYGRLSTDAWKIMWRVHDREARWPEEPRFVPRRWKVDVQSYAQHMRWMDGPAGGIRRTHQTVRQAIQLRRRLEADTALVEAEEAIADPLRMIPYLLDDRAFEGKLVAFDGDHKEVKPGNTKATRAPLATIQTSFRCLMPAGKKVWWTAQPDKAEAVVVGVVDDKKGLGSHVTVKFLRNLACADAVAKTTDSVCFSELTTKVFRWDSVPAADPWTHVPMPHTPSPLED